MTTNVSNIQGDYIIRVQEGTGFVYVQGNLDVSEDATVHGNTILGDSRDQTIDPQASFINDLVPLESATYDIGTPDYTWNELNFEKFTQWGDGPDNTNLINNLENVGNTFPPYPANPLGRPYDPGDIYGLPEHREIAALYVKGGVGIEKDLNVGGFIYGRVEIANTTLSVLATATNIDYEFFPLFTENTGSHFVEIDNQGAQGGWTYNPALGRITTDRILVAEEDTSTSPTTGVLQVRGGIGVSKDVYIEDKLDVDEVVPHSDNSGNIGTSSTQWAEAYVHDIYTRVIQSTTGTVQINPAANVTEIIGDIRVRGERPIGTAPMVTNTLHVTMDGDDTNDGRAQDPSRACRTIGGAMKSPYYQPGTQILVAAGHYYEDNPLPMKPYTSVRGSDIRTTFIEPINKTQDLFHVNSGCYLNYMTFLNGRSGLLEGEYAEGFNRGAYATAFPPLEGDERIDLYQSPYVQNCTNQSGPWLKDGTMFIPNQTVQVPLATAVGSWNKGTSTIVVSNVEGTIERGMSINAGQQNPGFFNARSLMLSNKPFLQEQVVAYVDRTFNTGTFIYDTIKCERDTGLIVDSIAMDMLTDSTSESIFAGLQYWRQSGYVDAINGQITTTTAAITFAKALAVSTVTDAASSSEGTIVSNRFDDILTILNTSTSTLVTGEFSQWVTDSIISNSTASNNVLVNAGFDALINAKDSIIDQTIDYINGTLIAFTYDSVKCSRDTGLIVDAIAQDLLFEGVSQSSFAGIQYWNQSGYVGGIENELTTTTNAITYVKSLAQKIVTGDTSGTRYQTAVSQVTNMNTATSSESATIGTDFDVILNILASGTTGVTDIIVPNDITPSSNNNVQYAYNLLLANKEYIVAEAIAYVEDTKTVGFSYDQTKCERDVGYMIDSVAFDLLYSGNKQAVQSGVYYYEYNASSTAVPNEIPQVTAAYNYMKTLITNVIRRVQIPTGDLYQTLVPQVTTSTNFGTPIEADEAVALIDRIIDIVNNGPTGVEKEPINLTRSENEYAYYAAQQLKLNRNFIRAEVVAYVDTLTEYLYDETKCRRDVGYMIDSVAFDLLHGGNKQSIKSGVYYFGYTEDTTEVPNEVPQVIAAYAFIKSLIGNVVKAEQIISPYQTSVLQDTSLPFATDAEVDIITSKIDIINGIIRNGPSSADPRIPINITQSQSSNILNAYNLLVANRNFISAEVLAYLDTFGTFDYSREFCFRDVGILVENVSYDASFGGNEKSVESGLAYYDGVVSKISGQEIQTVAAIDYLNQLVQKVITNNTCTDLLAVGTSSTATYYQIINPVLVGGSVASNSIKDLFNTITTIIENGPTASPDIYRGTNVDAAYVSAETLMQANRKFIQEDTINYINNLVQTFPYSEIKCRRDLGLIIDSVAFDLLYPTTYHSQSTFAGLQYWNQEGYTGDIGIQLQPTLAAINYLKELSIKIIQNITPTDDLVPRYQNTFTQVTSLQPGTTSEADILSLRFDEILDIVGGNNTGWTDKIQTNGAPSILMNVKNAVALLQANKTYMAHEVTAYVDAVNSNFVYDADLCRRDVGYIVDAVAFDLLNTGNRQSVQAGLYYYGFNTSTITIQNQEIQTTAAFNYLATIAGQVVKGIPVTVYQNNANQYMGSSVAGNFESNSILSSISTITNIITNGPGVASTNAPIAFTASFTATVVTAFDLLNRNRQFLIEETIAYIDRTYNPTSFNYDEALCYRDIGLIVDAVSQDVLLGGNSKAIEAGLAYWNYGVSHVAGQETTTTMAINYARDLALQVSANQTVTPQTQTVTTQIINPFFQYGGDYMPRQAIRRGFDIVTTIINRGPIYAPPSYAGSSLFAQIGLAPDEVQLAPTVVSITTISSGTYVLGLNTATVGFGNNSTLYFGETLTYPMQDNDVESISLEYTGNTSSWNMRKVDPIGSMGGSLVDGGVISERSPIQSFVYDAFTQLTQGGRGVHIKRDGYAQLVSVFTIFSSVGVEVESGGIASIVNSNANFGNICLKAKGYGKRKFSGQIYNPSFKAYPESPDVPGGDYFNQYYPNGFWPNNAQVAVYLPEVDDRPHISLVMEVVPPEDHLNEQGFPGFLNASPTTSTLTTGTITLNNIDTTGIAVGNTVYVRDQYGNTTSTMVDSLGNWIPYVEEGTVVSNLDYNSITLSKALPSGGGDVDNPNYFDFYFCGNAYYTVLSSEVIPNPQYNDNNAPIPAGVNILSTSSTGLDVSQVPAHVSALQFLNSLTNAVINNTIVTSLQSGPTTSTQTILPLVVGGGQAQSFIDLRFGEIIDIVNAPDVTAAEKVIKPNLRTKSGPAVQNGGKAITLIESNLDFLADEVAAYVTSEFTTGFTYDETTCRRDAGYIIDGARLDAALGSNWNGVYSGIAYSRSVSSAVTATELTQTIGALNYLQDKAAISLNANSIAVSRSNDSFYETINILTEGESAADQVTYPIPSNKTSDDDEVKALNLLIANKDFMKAEIVAWINEQITIGSGIWSGFTYDSVKCSRDVGYLVDSLCYDVLYGGNWASIISARAYFSGTTVIPGETAQTAAAFDRLSTIAQAIVLGTSVTPSTGNTESQNTSLPPATATEATTVDSLLQIIEDVITAGSLGGLPSVVEPDTSWTESSMQLAVAQLSSDKTGIIDSMIVFINDEYVGSFSYDSAQCKRDVKTIMQRLIYDIQTGGRYNSVMCGLAYWSRTGTYHKVQLGENVTRTDLFPHNATVNFYQRSYMSASGYVFEYVGAGTNYGALPQRGVADPVQSKETVQLDSGKVFFTSTDQNGDFRIGPGLVISQATGVLSGRTFTRSLFANLTPFILAIEQGGG